MDMEHCGGYLALSLASFLDTLRNGNAQNLSMLALYVTSAGDSTPIARYDGDVDTFTALEESSSNKSSLRKLDLHFGATTLALLEDCFPPAIEANDGLVQVNICLFSSCPSLGFVLNKRR